MTETVNLGSEFKSSGITENTPKNIMLGAGTIHKGLAFATGKWNFEESLVCATSGGSKVSIVPKLIDIPVDGATVKVKGLTQKRGETAKMEINPVEITPDVLKMAIVAEEAASEVATGYTEMTSKARIETGDYLENVAFVGKTLEGKPIIITFDYALCTSGLDMEAKDGNPAVPKLILECYAELKPEADKLPYHIYYITPSV